MMSLAKGGEKKKMNSCVLVIIIIEIVNILVHTLPGVSRLYQIVFGLLFFLHIFQSNKKKKKKLIAHIQTRVK